MHSIASLASILNEPGFAQRRAAQTMILYRRHLARLGRAGIVELEHVRQDELRHYVDIRLGQVSARSVAIEVQTLFAVLSHLERTDRFDIVTLRQLRRLKPENRAPQLLSAKWLTPEAVEDLCVVAGIGTLNEYTIRLAVLSGLRAGELSRLRWTDVDLAARCLTVRWSDDARGGIKTRRERCVPLVAPLVELLQRHPFARLIRDHGLGLVACQRSASARSLSKRVQTARRGPDGNPIACLNLLRHTRASWWVQAGVPIAKVAAWLGHSPEICARYYAGLVRGYDPDADRVSS